MFNWTKIFKNKPGPEIKTGDTVLVTGQLDPKMNGVRKVKDIDDSRDYDKLIKKVGKRRKK